MNDRKAEEVVDLELLRIPLEHMEDADLVGIVKELKGEINQLEGEIEAEVNPEAAEHLEGLKETYEEELSPIEEEMEKRGMKV